ncbi:alpha-acetolactate decarboxylase [Aspergillus steynii IBT 23096]|uniref:Alpha-acetolactate decarboxylase n=1 Tax=Aspergillus steynii IBT 23096 TaxID=1392250 RepID=A0A2I2GNX7_9EURO|nr:alpha-acetolactate decarboxylase [Aspergillus steynii IBT 23096]PLB54577.1 alpha-acetolactate decarboxylase [Aspergillus steynii IBT 23096]
MANQIYQYSLLSALMHGVCHEGPAVQQVLSHGDHGLGTIRGLDGEILILDGRAYHFPPDPRQSPKILSPTSILPYVMITTFQPTHHKRLSSVSMSSLPTALCPLLPNQKNSFISLRLDGLFQTIRVRVIPAQSRPRESLKALAARQVISEYRDVRGVVFGFWSPQYASGFSVAGFHLHFMSEDGTSGGHVVGFEAGGEEVKLAAAVIRDYQVEVPGGSEFHEIAIGNVAEEELHAA